MKIAVISDTHGLLRPEVIRVARDCGVVLHAGDILRESDLDELALYARVYAVRGNCDFAPWAAERLRDVLRFELGGVRFLMVHDRRNAPRDLEGVQAVIFGHTHHYEETRADGRLWLNPGTCGVPRFGNEVTLAVLTVENGKLTPRRVDLPL